jgi:hypothetical protein
MKVFRYFWSKDGMWPTGDNNPDRYYRSEDYDALASRLAEAERRNAEMADLLLSFTTSSWLNDHHKRRINAVLMPADSASADHAITCPQYYDTFAKCDCNAVTVNEVTK